MGRFTFDRDLRAHIVETTCRNVEKTPFINDPFPHIQIEGFLPDDVFEDVSRLFPPMEYFEPFAYDKFNSNGSSNRLRFQPTNSSISRLSANARVFWHSLRSALSSRELKSAVYKKLSKGLMFRYGCQEASVVDLNGFALPELFFETDGYSIKPHPDTRKKVVTMQIALPQDDSKKSFGTEFYQRSLNPVSWLREPRGFHVAKTMPFLPNSAYAFVVLNTLTLKSWHGRTAIDGTLGERRSLLNIWYEKPQYTYAEIVEEMNTAEPVFQSSAANEAA